MRKVLLVAVLWFSSLPVFAPAAIAQHVYAGHLTWIPVPGQSDSARFTLILGFKGTDVGNPAVGDVIQTTISLCPGNSTNCLGTNPLSFKVISPPDPIAGILLAQAQDPNSPVNLSIDAPINSAECPNPSKVAGALRAASNNNPNGAFELLTDVDSSLSNGAPLAAPFLPVYNVRAGDVASIPVRAVPRLSDHNRIVYRLADPCEGGCTSSGEFCGVLQPPGTFQEPNGLTVDPATGDVTWNTQGAMSGLWSCQVVMEEHDSNSGNWLTQSGVDFMVNLLNCFGDSAPAFVSPSPASGSSRTVHAGQTVTFTLKANDPDANDRVTLDAKGIPQGATMVPALPATANPVSSTFTWTTTMGDVGDHILLFYCQDTCGLQSLCMITISVLPPICLQPAATTGKPLMRLQRWRIPNDPNIQGLTNEDDFKKVPRKIWFTEYNAGKIGHLLLPDTGNCNPAVLDECNLLPPFNGEIVNPPHPFKITFAKQAFQGDRLNRRVWFTDPLAGTIDALIPPRNSLDSCRVYSYPVDTGLGRPWEIQWQPKFKVTITQVSNPTPPVIFESRAKIWYSVNPPSDRIFSFDPVKRILQRFTLPIGVIDAFSVDAGFVWIAAREPFANVEFIYAMPVVSGRMSYQWIVNSSIVRFTAIRSMYQVNPQNTFSLPYQVWLAGTTADSLGSTIILRLSPAAAVDTVCVTEQDFLKAPNGLFTPFPAKTISFNRMFLTQAFDTNFITANRALPQAALSRTTLRIPVDTATLNFNWFSAPHVSRRVPPVCDTMVTSSCAEACVVEQWKAVPPAGSLSFSDAMLNIDMVGNHGSKLFAPTLTRGPLALEYNNVVLHEPRNGADGLIDRLAYRAVMAATGLDNSDESSIDGESADGQSSLAGFRVYDAYPNPFNPTATLSFAVGTQSFVTMKVYNVLGQEVATLLNHEYCEEGERSIEFNAGNLASGVYFYRILAEPIAVDGRHPRLLIGAGKMLLVR